MTAPRPSGRAGALRAWLPHLALLGVAIAMVVVARARHLSTEDAFAVAFDDARPAEDRIWAAHVAANRATERDTALGDALVRAFFISRDELLQEYALTIDLCRHASFPPGAPPDASPPLQSAYAYGGLPDGEWTPHRLRALVLYRRKVGGSGVGGIRRLALDEARWFLDTLRGTPLPDSDVIDGYLKERSREPANLRRSR